MAKSQITQSKSRVDSDAKSPPVGICSCRSERIWRTGKFDRQSKLLTPEQWLNDWRAEIACENLSDRLWSNAKLFSLPNLSCDIDVTLHMNGVALRCPYSTPASI